MWWDSSYKRLNDTCLCVYLCTADYRQVYWSILTAAIMWSSACVLRIFWRKILLAVIPCQDLCSCIGVVRIILNYAHYCSYLISDGLCILFGVYTQGLAITYCRQILWVYDNFSSSNFANLFLCWFYTRSFYSLCSFLVED